VFDWRPAVIGVFAGPHEKGLTISDLRLTIEKQDGGQVFDWCSEVVGALAWRQVES
jgi:hypothetical protein